MQEALSAGKLFFCLMVILFSAVEFTRSVYGSNSYTKGSLQVGG